MLLEICKEKFNKFAIIYFISHIFLSFRVSVRLGEHKLSTEEDCDELICSDPVQDILIEKVTRHANFTSTKKFNDVALLRLKSAADVSGRFVKTICLPASPETQIESTNYVLHEMLTIVGWGKLGSNEESDVMMKASVSYVDRENCTKRFTDVNTPIYETFLCAGGKKENFVSVFIVIIVVVCYFKFNVIFRHVSQTSYFLFTDHMLKFKMFLKFIMD